jgi:hypothetical protein
MATRLTRKTVALGDGGPERAEPGASYGDRRAMQARPPPTVSTAPAVTTPHQWRGLFETAEPSTG